MALKCLFIKYQDNITSIELCSASDFSRYSYSLGDALKEGIRKATVGGATGGVFWLLIFCIFALAFWYGAKLTRDDCLDPGAILQVCHILV